MDGPSTSSPNTNMHFVFTDLLRILNEIPHPTCVADGCLGCRYGKRIHVMRIALGKLSGFEQDLFKQMEAFQREGALDSPRLQELIRNVERFIHQLPTTLDEKPIIRLGQRKDTALPASQYVFSPGISRTSYDHLTDEEMKCLYCCSAFNNGGFKKRMLINWWIAEGILPNVETTRVEQAGELMFKKLKWEGFIRQESEEAKEETFFDLNAGGILAASKAIMLKSDTNILRIVNTSPLNWFERVINVNRCTISSTEASVIAYMHSLKVLHLGRSKPSESIQVKGLNLIMNRLNKKKQLKLLSLQGITSIDVLPDLVCNVISLMVLDLRGCHALRSLPSRIRNLKSLTHLDMSDCYILLPLPKEISSLSKLEVLKGFVIAPPKKGTKSRCTLRDLRKLKKLYKLSISVSTTNFPQQQDLTDLANMMGLVKLKILWTSGSKPQEPHQDEADTKHLELPCTGNHASCFRRNQMEETDVFEKLEKLELWCTPEDVSPLLLAPRKFPTLKQLKIVGAEFQQLNSHDTWNVEILKLLYSPNLVMNREDWTLLFPNVLHLKVQDCPKVESFPPSTDQEGV